MDAETYKLITSVCKKKLLTHLHNGHLEDCIQHCALLHLQGKTNIMWNVIDYCRINGLCSNARLYAKTLSTAISIDTPTEDGLSSYLLDEESILKSNIDEQNRNYADLAKGVLEEFLAPLNLNNEVLRWTLQHYKVKTR